jgi:hypothetical protein
MKRIFFVRCDEERRASEDLSWVYILEKAFLPDAGKFWNEAIRIFWCYREASFGGKRQRTWNDVVVS